MTLVEEYLERQQSLTAVERFARWHENGHRPALEQQYKALLPASPPKLGQQYAFEVDLDSCSGCKSCVTACHSLNGLDADEAWRGVGLLVGPSGSAPYQQ